MSLQAVHLLPAVCPGEEGGTGERRGTRPAPGGDPRPREGTLGPAAAARPLRWVALGSWEWGLGRSPTCRDREPGDPRHPQPTAPSLGPAGRLPTTAPEPHRFKDTSIPVFFAPYSNESCHCVERKSRDPSDFKGPLVWLSCHPYR